MLTLPGEKNGEGIFCYAVELCHLIADGCTYYKIIGQLEDAFNSPLPTSDAPADAEGGSGSGSNQVWCYTTFLLSRAEVP